MNHSKESWIYHLIFHIHLLAAATVVIAGIVAGVVYVVGDPAPQEVTATEGGTLVKQGSFTTNSAAGTQSITGVGFQPKAIVFYWTGEDTTDGTTDGVRFGMGSVAEVYKSGGINSYGGAASTLYFGGEYRSVATSSNSHIKIYKPTGLGGTVTTLNAQVTSLDVDGFTLNWANAPGGAYVVHYYALGGSDILSAAHGEFIVGDDIWLGGDTSIDVDFRPDLILLMSEGIIYNPGGTGHGEPAHPANFSVGFGTASNQGVVNYYFEDGIAISETCSRQRTSHILSLIDNTCSSNTLVYLDSFTDTGFTLVGDDLPTHPTQTQIVRYLAIRGGSHKVGSFSKSPSTGLQTIAGLDHTPKGVFAASRNQVTNAGITAVSDFSIGASSGSGENGAIGVSGPNGAALEASDRRTITDKVYTNITGNTGALIGEATLSSFASDEMVWNWNIADAVEREILYWTVADATTLTQSGYRFFGNQNTDPGDAKVAHSLAAENTPAVFTATGTPIRLRALMHAETNPLPALTAFKLQYAERVGTCDTGFSGETYADVSTSTGAVRLYNNSNIGNNANVVATSSDPTHDGHTVEEQVYVEVNNFVGKGVEIGNDGLWDFALADGGEASETVFCIRIVKAGGGLLDSYEYIPEITTVSLVAPYDTLEQKNYRWYKDANTKDPSNNEAVAAENTKMESFARGRKRHLRISVASPSGDFAAGQDFKLQYQISTTTGSWTDVGSGAFSGVNYGCCTDGEAITALRLTNSTVTQSYEENGTSTSTPNSIPDDGIAEWNWTVTNDSAALGATYYFRMVGNDPSETEFADYENYPQLTTASLSGTSIGEVVSVIFDTGVDTGAQLNSFQWIGPHTPDQASGDYVRLQFASAPSAGGPWSFVGPEGIGGESDWYTPSGPSISTTIAPEHHKNHRYFRYKVRLESTTGLSPVVQRVIINWSR